MSKHLHRTAVFTLHNPTRHVRAVLDHAFTVYTHAYTVALDYFATYAVEELQAMATYCLDDKGLPKVSAKRLAQSLFQRDATMLTEVLQPLESGMRESLKEDVAATLLSYVALSTDPKQQSPSYPRHFSEATKAEMREDALSHLATLADDLEEENSLRDQLNRTRQAEYVPISFVRVEAERNCGLFYNPETKRFYTRLYVVSPSSRYAKLLTVAGRYIDVRTGAVYMRDEDACKEAGVESFGRFSKTSILVPLEMGKYHEQALRFTESAFLPQRTGEGKPATPVSAKLVKTADDYQLHVAFRLPKPERVKPVTLLGIDRGITCLAAGAVTSLDGKQVLETFVADGTELRDLQRQMEQNTRTRQAKGQVTKGDRKRAKVAENHVHLCANQIVDLAIKHQAQVVMEDLENFAQPRDVSQPKKRSNFRAMLSRRQYENILKAVDMKLTLVGLPPVRTVSATFTSLTCSVCGHIGKENRDTEDRTRFHCAECGHTDHADQQAGVNIARKLLWLQLRGKEHQAGISTEKRTAWATFAQTFSPKD